MFFLLLVSQAPCKFSLLHGCSLLLRSVEIQKRDYPSTLKYQFQESVLTGLSLLAGFRPTHRAHALLQRPRGRRALPQRHHARQRAVLRVLLACRVSLPYRQAQGDAHGWQRLSWPVLALMKA